MKPNKSFRENIFLYSKYINLVYDIPLKYKKNHCKSCISLILILFLAFVNSSCNKTNDQPKIFVDKLENIELNSDCTVFESKIKSKTAPIIYNLLNWISYKVETRVDSFFYKFTVSQNNETNERDGRIVIKSNYLNYRIDLYQNKFYNIKTTRTQKNFFYFSIPYYNKSYFEASGGIISKVDSNGLRIKSPIFDEIGEIKDWIGVGFMYKSSKMTMFMSPGAGNPFTVKGLYKYSAGDNSWRRVLKLEEEQWIWSMAEDSYGNLYSAVYLTKGDNYRNFPAIYKSSDGGSTWVLLFNLYELPQKFNHIHGIAIDKKTNRMYISVGDKGKVGNLMSDYPYTETKSANLLDGQTTKVLATKTARIWGSDATGYCRIYRTTDDRTYTTVYNSTYKNIYEIRQSDFSGYIYAIQALDTSTGASIGSVQILVSRNDGITWSTLANVDNLFGGKGFRKMSQFKDGRAFVTLYNAEEKKNEEFLIEETVGKRSVTKILKK